MRFPSAKSFIAIQLLGKKIASSSPFGENFVVTMAYSELNAIQTALLTFSQNCLEKAWSDVERLSQDLSVLIQAPERKMEAVTEGLEQWNTLGFKLESNRSFIITIHGYTQQPLVECSCEILEFSPTDFCSQFRRGVKIQK